MKTIKITRNTAFDLSGAETEPPDEDSQHYIDSQARSFAIRYFKVRANCPDSVLIQEVRKRHGGAKILDDSDVLSWFHMYKTI